MIFSFEYANKPRNLLFEKLFGIHMTHRTANFILYSQIEIKKNCTFPTILFFERLKICVHICTVFTEEKVILIEKVSKFQISRWYIHTHSMSFDTLIFWLIIRWLWSNDKMTNWKKKWQLNVFIHFVHQWDAAPIWHFACNTYDSNGKRDGRQ